ncbi:permease-like cell division protein FtsX [Micromonospora sp. BL4]|uniref:permease-like cell division protein FtsX n=1 Tax=Micromonospora sp. BL4 TaxID=2478710 RepID=UPI0011C4232D|nr:permease-like cell division protein FtsX [Micromonospora sp. BL4]
MRRVTPVLAFVLLLAFSACTSEPEEMVDSTLTVFLDSDVTAATKSAVEQRLRSMPSVEDVALGTREQAYESLKESLKDSPDLLADLRPEILPESFRATVTDASVAEAVELVMAEADGVEDVALRTAQIDPLPSHIGVIVRLESAVTGEQRAAVEKAVHALPDAESVAFEDRDAAYERLREQCRGRGELAAQLDPQMTRASLRFQMPLDPKGPGLSGLLKLDGVDVVRLVPMAML